MHTLHSALAFAEHAHRNQQDKSGKPYFEHVARVVGNAQALLDGLPPGTISDEDQTAILIGAALHDVAEDHEDTGVTHADLAQQPFPALALKIARRLDKANKVGSTYQGNIENIAIEGDIGTIIVKLADNMDNGDPLRIASLPPEQQSISQRYARARAVLQAAYEEFREIHRGLDDMKNGRIATDEEVEDAFARFRK